MSFSSVKETNNLTSEEMSLLKKLTLSKLRFSLKENLKKCTTFEEQKGTNPCVRSLLICFSFREIKGFYQSSLGNKVDFTDRMKISSNILAKY